MKTRKDGEFFSWAMFVYREGNTKHGQAHHLLRLPQNHPKKTGGFFFSYC